MSSSNTRKRHGWSEESMKEAIAKVRSGEMSAYHASKTYGIPKQTLSDRLNGKG